MSERDRVEAVLAVLLPCPFCGGRPGYRTAFGIECMECTCSLACRLDQAETLWNRRASPHVTVTPHNGATYGSGVSEYKFRASRGGEGER